MGHIAQILLLGRGQQTVTCADFILGADDVHGSRGGLYRLAWRGVKQCFTTRHGGTAQVLGFVAKDFPGDGVLERRGIAEDAIARGPALAGGDQRATGVAYIGAIAIGHEHALVLGGDDARGLCKCLAVHHQRLGQEGLDQMRRQRGQGQVVQ